MIPLPIHDVRIEPQPIFGSHEDGGVFHLLSGGATNPAWFEGQPIHDVYACLAVPGKARGGHYHPKLDEQFYVVSGTALWVLSDERPDSPTYKAQMGVILGEAYTPSVSLSENVFLHTRTNTAPGFVRLVVPHGVYHEVHALGASSALTIALGTTAYDKEDYVYPKVEINLVLKNYCRV